MSNTLYAAFTDASMAEKAAGALLDHGVRAEDLSMVQHESAKGNAPYTVAQDTGVTPVEDMPRDVKANTGPYGDTMDEDRGALGGPTAQTVMQEEYFATAQNEADYSREMGYEFPYNPDNEPTDVSDNTTSKYVDSDDVTSKREDSGEVSAKHGISTTTGADAGAAAITGGAWGLGLGALAAIVSLLIPGFGIVVGGGALATALGGLVATTGAGAAVGALTGYLKDQGVEEHVAQKYGETVAGGGAILAINVPSGDVDEAQARQLLDKYGAINVNTYALAESPKPYMS